MLGLAAGIGGLMALGGIASAVAGGKVKTKPKPSYYGGSQENLQAYKDTYGEQRRAGLDASSAAQSGLVGRVNASGDLQGGMADQFGAYGQQGQGVMSRGQDALLQRGIEGANMSGYADGVAQARLNAPSVAVAQAQALANQQGLKNMAMARSGGLMGLRAASGNNAMATAQIANQSGAMRAAELQGLLANQQQVGQMGAQNALQAQGLGLQQLGLGAQMQQQGMSGQAGLYQNAAGMGLQREGMYLDAQQAVNEAQLGAEMGYDARRQQAAMNKQQGLMGLGGALIGGGANVLGMGMMGGGGGGQQQPASYQPAGSSWGARGY